MNDAYVVWSNEHKCWWAPDCKGYRRNLADAGRYSRDDALGICRGARGGREFNTNPSEVPLLLADAEAFWPDETHEWEAARLHREDRDRKHLESLFTGEF